MIQNYPDLFKDPHIQYPDLNANLPFSEYIQQCKTIIRNTRLDLDANAEKIIEANAPFEFYPKTTSENKKAKYGALLIHGLLDSPFTMRDIGTALQDDGLLVRSVLLPGHGTIPGALLNIHHQQWIDTIRYAAASLAREVEALFLVGYSTGGSLALYHAAQQSEKIAGIILLVPAFKINCPLDFLANKVAALGKVWPRAAWFRMDKQETLDYTKYRSTPFNAAYQVYQIGKKADQLNSINCPLFFALTANDVTVVSKVSMDYFFADTHPQSRMVVYTPHPEHTYDDKRVITRTSCYPEMNVLDFSHSTILIEPNNPHYGKNGDYAEASHTDTDTQVVYSEYFIPTMNFHNFLYKHKLAKHEYQRLTYNPDFAFLCDEMKGFILSC